MEEIMEQTQNTPTGERNIYKNVDNRRIIEQLYFDKTDTRKKDNNGNVFIMFDAEDGRLYLSIVSAKYETNIFL